MRTPIPERKPKLKPGVIYWSDNGRTICLECAGMMAKFTGRDISGQKVMAVPYSETIPYHKEFGVPLSCEAGCTTYLLPDNASPRRL